MLSPWEVGAGKWQRQVRSQSPYLALCVSAITAWLTLFRRGAVKMTQPTVIDMDRAESHLHRSQVRIHGRCTRADLAGRIHPFGVRCIEIHAPVGRCQARPSQGEIRGSLKRACTVQLLSGYCRACHSAEALLPLLRNPGTRPDSPQPPRRASTSCSAESEPHPRLTRLWQCRSMRPFSATASFEADSR